MKHRTGYVFKKGANYFCQWRVEGRTFVKRLSDENGEPVTTVKDAEQARQRLMAPYTVANRVEVLETIKGKLEGARGDLAKIEDERNPPLAVADSWHAYERAGNRKEINPNTLYMYTRYWKAFSGWLATAHPEVKALRDVSFSVCEDYKEHLLSLKITGRTFNAHRAFLRSFFNVLADKARLTEGNPWAKITPRDEHCLSRRPLTVEELRKVCHSAEGELRVMMAFGLYLGARMGDAACMEWGQCDMARRMISYTPRKTARKKPEAMLIPMHPELYGVLSETPPERRKGRVTPEMAAQYERGMSCMVSQAIQRHFKNCGLTTTATRDGAGVRRHVVAGFHSLRHSAVSLMREAGAAQSISQAIVGHNSPEIHALYTHTDEDALRRAVAMLPAVIGDTTAPALPPAKMIEAHAVRELAERLTSKTAKEIRAELLKLTESENVK